MYGEFRTSMMRLREITQDKEIKCYALTSDYMLYSITRISKFYLYCNTTEGEQRLYKPLKQIFINESEVVPYLELQNSLLNGKVTRIFNGIYQLNELLLKQKGEH